VSAVAVGSPASAAGEKATIGAPFADKWADDNGVYNIPYDDVYDSHPSVHTRLYMPAATWATDLYPTGGVGTSVNLHVTSSGTLTFGWLSSATGCGTSTMLKIMVDGVQVGTLYLAHLASAVTSGTITNGMKLGEIGNFGGCNPQNHVHVEFTNSTSGYSCYTDHGKPSTTLSEGDALGVLGSSNTGAREACITTPGGPAIAHKPSSDNNGSGYDDLAWYQGTTLYMLGGNGAGQFGIVGSTGGIGYASWAGAGTNDPLHQAEVYWYQPANSTLYVFKWLGSSWGTMGYTTSIGAPDYAVVGDYNGDGWDDIAWYQSGVLTLLQANGNGLFSIIGGSAVGMPDWAGGGVNNTSNQAEVYWHQGSTIYVLRWGGTSWYVTGTTGGIGTPTKAASGDFNGDTFDDIAWYQSGSLYMLQANGSGLFSIVGATSGVGTPDWAGSGINNTIGGSGTFDLYLHHSDGTIKLYRWGGSSWGIVGTTTGIGTPDRAASARS
jgi:hypothetical protein